MSPLIELVKIFIFILAEAKNSSKNFIYIE